MQYRKLCVGFHGFLINHSWIKFLINGVFVTTFTYSLYLLFLLAVSFELAFTLSFISGILTSFLTNKRFVFRSNASILNFTIYLIYAILIYLISLIGLRLLVLTLDISSIWAPILISFLVTPINFFVTKRIITLRKEVF